MSGRGALLCPPCTESPFASLRCDLAEDSVYRYLSQHYPALIATTDSCARPTSSHRLRFPSACGSLQVVASPYWTLALPDVSSAVLSPRAWTPTPAALVVHSPVSSHKTSAFPALGPGRRLATSIQRLPYGLVFEAAIILLCSGPQVSSPPRSLLPQCLSALGSRGFYVRAYHGLLPPRAADMLAV
jgi:hypothetical protein